MKKSVALFSLCAAIAAWFLFSWPALVSLHQRWIRTDEPYAIGYPAALMSLWWLFNRRVAIFARPVGPSLSALLALVIVLLLSAAAGLVHLQVVQQAAVPASLWLVVSALLGWRAGWRSLPAFLVFCIAIPLWDISVPLRTMTVWFTQNTLGLMGIPAFISGYNIALPAGVIEVAGSCSGFNLLLAALFIGLAYGEVAQQSNARRAALVALAAVVGILDNWIRVLLLVLIAHYSEMKHDLIYHHGSFGWWIFAGSLVPFFLLARRIEQLPARSGSSASFVAHPFVTSSFARVPFASLAIMATAVAVVCAGLQWGAGSMAHRRGLAAAGFALPAEVIPVSSGWMPQYRGQDISQFWRVTDHGRVYELTALTYLVESRDKKLIYYANHIADEYRLRATDRQTIAADLTVNTAIIKDGEWRMVWWFWWVDGATSTSALTTKVLQFKALLLGDRSSALMAVSTRCASVGCIDEQQAAAPAAIKLLQTLRSATVAHR